MTWRTSQTHPLRVAEITPGGGGLVGVTLCPGKRQSSAMTGAWARSLDLDLGAVNSWGAKVVLTLVTATELSNLQVEGLGAAVARLGLTWLHLPIEDRSTPTAEWETQWSAHRAPVHRTLDAGGRVLVHCMGGLGRAGLVAACILVERGAPAAEAIEAVRLARPGAIETTAQEAYVFAIRSAWEGERAGTA